MAGLYLIGLLTKKPRFNLFKSILNAISLLLNLGKDKINLYQKIKIFSLIKLKRIDFMKIVGAYRLLLKRSNLPSIENMKLKIYML